MDGAGFKMDIVKEISVKISGQRDTGVPSSNIGWPTQSESALVILAPVVTKSQSSSVKHQTRWSGVQLLNRSFDTIHVLYSSAPPRRCPATYGWAAVPQLQRRATPWIQLVTTGMQCLQMKRTTY